MNENIVGRFRTREEAEACRDWFKMPDTLAVEDADGEARVVLTSNHFSIAEAAELALMADAFKGGLDAWHTIFRSQKLRPPLQVGEPFDPRGCVRPPIDPDV